MRRRLIDLSLGFGIAVAAVTMNIGNLLIFVGLGLNIWSRANKLELNTSPSGVWEKIYSLSLGVYILGAVWSVLFNPWPGMMGWLSVFITLFLTGVE